jgi:hypothetical protein
LVRGKHVVAVARAEADIEEAVVGTTWIDDDVPVALGPHPESSICCTEQNTSPILAQRRHTNRSLQGASILQVLASQTARSSLGAQVRTTWRLLTAPGIAPRPGGQVRANAQGAAPTQLGHATSTLSWCCHAPLTVARKSCVLASGIHAQQP